MRTIEIRSSDDLDIKRWYFKPVTFKKACSECGQDVFCHNDMFEYPQEGATLYFECEKCNKNFNIRMTFISSQTICKFMLEDDSVEIIIES